MKATELQKLSYRDLLALHQRVAAAIEAKRTQDREVLKQRMNKLASEAGFSLTDVLTDQQALKPRKTKTPRRRMATGKPNAVVRFRHPKNESLTWSGQGRRPRWLVEAGGNIERFRVA